jgi:hypothetical protein
MLALDGLCAAIDGLATGGEGGAAVVSRVGGVDKGGVAAGCTLACAAAAAGGGCAAMGAGAGKSIGKFIAVMLGDALRAGVGGLNHVALISAPAMIGTAMAKDSDSNFCSRPMPPR